MRVGVDEAGRDGLAAANHLTVGAGAAQVAHRHDTIARDADIRLEARAAGAVEHGDIADDQVAAQRHECLVRE